MSNSPDTGLDLEDLELQLPARLGQAIAGYHRFAKYEGGADSGPRDRDRGERRARPPGRPTGSDARAGDQRRPRDAAHGRRVAKGKAVSIGRAARNNASRTSRLPDISLTWPGERRSGIAGAPNQTDRPRYPIFDIAHLF